MKIVHGLMALLMMAGGATALAQDAAPAPPAGMEEMHAKHMAEMMHGGGPHGLWWNNPKVAAELNLSQDQKTKLGAIMQQNRINLIDLHATLEKEEATLDPLMSADTPDEAKVTGQIDKVAQARAELEKSHARMLLQMRTVLTPDQWSKLQAMHGGMMHMHMEHPSAPAAPAPPQ